MEFIKPRLLIVVLVLSLTASNLSFAQINFETYEHPQGAFSLEYLADANLIFFKNSQAIFLAVTPLAPSDLMTSGDTLQSGEYLMTIGIVPRDRDFLGFIEGDSMLTFDTLPPQRRAIFEQIYGTDATISDEYELFLRSGESVPAVDITTADSITTLAIIPHPGGYLFPSLQAPANEISLRLPFWLAMLDSFQADFDAILALEDMDAPQQLNAPAPQLAIEPTLPDHVVYNYLDGALQFEHPQDWNVLGERTNRQMFAILSNADLANFYDGNAENPEDGRINIVLNTQPAYAASNTLGEDYLSFDADTLAEVTELIAGQYMGTSGFRLTGDSFVVDTPNVRHSAGSVTVFQGENDSRVAYFTAVPQADGMILLAAIANAPDAELMRGTIENLLMTLAFDAELATNDDYLTYFEDTGAELGATGFEVSGTGERAMVVADATWITEPSFIGYSRLNNQTFDFYLTSNADVDWGSTYIQFRDVPLDIAPGTYDNQYASLVTAKAGIFIDSSMVGTLTIDREDNGRLSGSFDLVSDEDYNERRVGAVRGVFSEVQIPDITPCLQSGTTGEDAQFSLTVTSPSGEYDLPELRYTGGVWGVHSSDTYDRDLGAIEDGRFAIYLFAGEDIDPTSSLGSEISLQFVNIPQAPQATTYGFEVELRAELGANLEGIQLPGGTIFSNDQLTLTEVGDTLSGEFVLRDGDATNPELLVEGSFSGIPVPQASCRLVGGARTSPSQDG